MPLVYIDGVEGSGKSTLMTRELRYHHLCGGRVFALPGYELLNQRGRVVSELLMPEEWIKLLKENIFDYAVGIDEIQNFLNKHKWQDQIVDLLAYGAAAQRRKRRFAIIATGPMFAWLPKDLKDMFHEVVHMKDRHWKIKTVPRGEQFIITREDLRGMLSGSPGTRTRPKIFHGIKYRKYFNSFSIVDPDWQLRKVSIQREKVLVDRFGNEIPDSDEAETPRDRFLIKWAWLISIIQQLRTKGINLLRPDELTQYLGTNLSKGIREALPALGVVWNNNAQAYSLNGYTVAEADTPLPQA